MSSIADPYPNQVTEQFTRFSTVLGKKNGLHGRNLRAVCDDELKLRDLGQKAAIRVWGTSLRQTTGGTEYYKESYLWLISSGDR